MKKSAKKQSTLLQKYLWWVRGGEVSLENIPKIKVITYVLNFADYQDIKVLLPTFSKSQIQKALASPLPGVWDKKSLHFWRVYFS